MAINSPRLAIIFAIPSNMLFRFLHIVIPGLKPFWVWAVCLLAATQVVHGQNISFRTVVNEKKIGMDDLLQVDYMLDNAGQPDQLLPPVFKGFVVTGQLNSMETVWNNRRPRPAFRFSFNLKPLRTGVFIIPGATVTINGASFSSNSVQVEVVKGSVSSHPGGNSIIVPPSPFDIVRPKTDAADMILRPGENVQEKIKKGLFLKVEASKKEVYLGEAVVASYKLYSVLNSNSTVFKRPSFSGASVIDMVDPESPEAVNENYNGKPFKVYYLRMAQLFPLQTGEIQLESMEVTNTVHFLKEEFARQRGGDLLHDLIRDFLNENLSEGTEDHKVTFLSEPVTIKVKPLPEAGKPQNFSGAVGKFSIRAELDRPEAGAGDAFQLRLSIEGAGNLPLISAPEVNWPQGVDGYEPVSRSDINKTVAPVSGTLVFEYTFTAGQKGEYAIPPINFSYFDPAKGSYQTISSDSLQFTVTNALPVKPIPESLRKKSTLNISAFLKSTLAKIMIGLAALGLVALLVFLFRKKKKSPPPIDTTEQPVEETPLRAAIENAEPAPAILQEVSWATAEARLRRADHSGFYKELQQVLWRFFTAKLKLSSTEMNKQVLWEKLTALQVPAFQVNQLMALLNECELSLYTPLHEESDMRIALENGKRIVEELRYRI